MSITRLANLLLKGVVALSLAFLCWLYVRSRQQESLDDVLIPVHVALAYGDQGRHEVETTGTGRILVSFAGPPSRMRELRSQLQHGLVKVSCTVEVPEDKQNDSTYRDTVFVEPGDVPVPPGVSVYLGEGRNSVAVTVHPRHRTYELTNVPVCFLCPPGFAWKPTFPSALAGKVIVRLIGPASDEKPQVQAYIDLTQGVFEKGRNREPLKLQLPHDFQPANETPLLVSFTLEPQ